MACNRLEEAESKVRVLQLVSVAVEVLGDSAQPHLGAVASALPQVRAHACKCPCAIALRAIPFYSITRLAILPEATSFCRQCRFKNLSERLEVL